MSDLTGYSIDTVYVTQLANTHVYKGDITFSSEAEIEEFVRNGYTRINGNVVIKNTVTSLSAFNNTLKSISGDLWCLGNITNYEGLGELTDIGGNFSAHGPFIGLNKLTNIGGNFSNCESCEGLDNLVSIGGDFNYSNQLNSFKGLSNLSRIEGIFGNLNDNLSSFEGLDNLEYVGKDFRAGTTANPNFTSFKGLEKLKYIGGELGVMIGRLESFEGLNNLESVGNIRIIDASHDFSTKGLDNLMVIKGDFELYIQGSEYIVRPIISFVGLKHLGEIAGNLKIINHINLKTLEGFDYLHRIGGDLIISGCDKLEDITAFPMLYEIGGDFIISECNKLKSIRTFSMLNSIKGNFSISKCQVLEYLETFKELNLLGGDFSIVSSSPSFIHFPFLKIIKGDFFIQYVNTESIELNNLERIQNLTIYVGSKLKNIDFINLKQVEGYFSISPLDFNTPYSLTSLTGFRSLEKVESTFAISNLVNLENIDFSNLKTAYSCAISKCPKLKDFTSLKNLAQNLDNFSIHSNGYNPTKEQILNGQGKPQE